MNITPTFSGEVQLAGWRESHTSGATVTFWLADPADLEVFRALTARKGNTAGQRFMAVLVEIGEDEQPVPPPAPAEPEKPKGGPLSKLAGQWCEAPEFQDWIADRHPLLWSPRAGLPCSQAAAEVIRELCRVSSRAELDHDQAAAQRFHTLIREPYSKHLASTQPA